MSGQIASLSSLCLSVGTAIRGLGQSNLDWKSPLWESFAVGRLIRIRKEEDFMVASSHARCHFSAVTRLPKLRLLNFSSYHFAWALILVNTRGTKETLLFQLRHWTETTACMWQRDRVSHFFLMSQALTNIEAQAKRRLRHETEESPADFLPPNILCRFWMIAAAAAVMAKASCSRSTFSWETTSVSRHLLFQFWKP